MDFTKKMIEENERLKQKHKEEVRIAQEKAEHEKMVRKATRVTARRAKIKAIPKKIIKGIKAGFTSIVFKPIKAVVMFPVYAVKGIKKYSTKKRIAKENALIAEQERQEKELQRLKELQERISGKKANLESRFSQDKVGKKEVFTKTSFSEVNYDGWEIGQTDFEGKIIDTTTTLYTDIGPVEIYKTVHDGYNCVWENDGGGHASWGVKKCYKEKIDFIGYVKIADNNGLTQIVYVDTYEKVFTSDFENYYYLNDTTKEQMYNYIEDKHLNAQTIKEDIGRE